MRLSSAGKVGGSSRHGRPATARKPGSDPRRAAMKLPGGTRSPPVATPACPAAPRRIRFATSRDTRSPTSRATLPARCAVRRARARREGSSRPSARGRAGAVANARSPNVLRLCPTIAWISTALRSLLDELPEPDRGDRRTRARRISRRAARAPRADSRSFASVSQRSMFGRSLSTVRIGGLRRPAVESTGSSSASARSFSATTPDQVFRPGHTFSLEARASPTRDSPPARRARRRRARGRRRLFGSEGGAGVSASKSRSGAAGASSVWLPHEVRSEQEAVAAIRVPTP